MTTMRAAVLHAVGDLRVDEHEIPTPGPGEVLVKVAVCGVCGSDATEYGRGPVLTVMPVTLGHEFAGTVAAVGDGVADFTVGATVVCGAGVSCGSCKHCLEGRTNLCRSYTTLGLQHDGGLAGYVLAPAETLLDVTDNLEGDVVIPPPTLLGQAVLVLGGIMAAIVIAGYLALGRFLNLIGPPAPRG